MDSDSLKKSTKWTMYIFVPKKSDKAEIDYVFYNQMTEELAKYVAVGSDETLKNSDHVPVFTILNLAVTQKDVDGNRTIKCKPRFVKCDRNAHESFLEENLKMCLLFYPGLKVIKLEYNLKVKLKRNDWLLVDTCP